VNIAILYSEYESALLLQKPLLEKKLGFTVILMPVERFWENSLDASLVILSDTVSCSFEETISSLQNLYNFRFIHLQLTAAGLMHCPESHIGFSMAGETRTPDDWAESLIKKAVRNCMIYNHYSRQDELPDGDLVSMLPFKPERGMVLIIKTATAKLVSTARRFESGVHAKEGFCCFLYDAPWLIMTAYLKPGFQVSSDISWESILNIHSDNICYMESDVSVSFLGVSLSKLLRLATNEKKGRDGYYPPMLPVLKKFREKLFRRQKSDWAYFLDYCFIYINRIYGHRIEKKQALLTLADAISLELAGFYESRGQIYHAEGLFRTENGVSTFVSIQNELRQHLLPALIRVGEFKQQGYGPVVLKALILINEKYGDSLGLAAAAEELQLSPQHLSRLFSEQTGASFTDYLLDLRLEKAKELLLSSTKSIKEICFEVGFQDPNYFSKMFKKRVGLPPSEYKEGKL